MEQKHFMEISYVKEQDTDLTLANTKGFEVGDQIVIQEKVDGTNASFTYDKENDMLIAFSRRNELNYNNTLRGFWNWIQELDLDTFSKYPDYVFFGEWLISHKIQYKQDAYKKFYFYDVWDRENECYLTQDKVKKLAEELGLDYVKTYYVGPFISWDHCRSFMNESDIAIEEPEGVVVKNQTKIHNLSNSRIPFVLKIVNEKFSERMKTKEKIIDPEKEVAKDKAILIAQEIVTRNRIEKEIYKMIDDGILPEKIEPEDMKIVAMNLPKRIYQDCVKEEPEMVKDAGEYFGKVCSSMSMTYARNIILGRKDELESCTE